MSVGPADAPQNLEQNEDPTQQGVALYKDNYLGYSFFRPRAWRQFSWLDGRRGVLFGPEEDNNSTLFGVAVQELGLKVNKGDTEDLYMGFITGIKRLPKIEIEWQNQWTKGSLIGMEAKYTFEEQGVTRKRWVRVIYPDTRQMTLNAQGETVADYDRWYSLFEQAMSSFHAHAAPGYKRKPKQPTPPESPAQE
jgi:hypothetical protein